MLISTYRVETKLTKKVTMSLFSFDEKTWEKIGTEYQSLMKQDFNIDMDIEVAKSEARDFLLLIGRLYSNS